MKDDVLFFQTMGAVKELTKQINLKMINPSTTSVEDIIDMSERIIEIVKKYKKEIGIYEH